MWVLKMIISVYTSFCLDSRSWWIAWMQWQPCCPCLPGKRCSQRTAGESWGGNKSPRSVGCDTTWCCAKTDRTHPKQLLWRAQRHEKVHRWSSHIHHLCTFSCIWARQRSCFGCVLSVFAQHRIYDGSPCDSSPRDSSHPTIHSETIHSYDFSQLRQFTSRQFAAGLFTATTFHRYDFSQRDSPVHCSQRATEQPLRA